MTYALLNRLRVIAARLGDHTDEVLSEVLGLDGAAIGKLHDAGVVAGPECDPTRLSSRP